MISANHHLHPYLLRNQIKESKKEASKCWDRYKARCWSDMKDEEDLKRAQESYEMERGCKN